MKNVKTIVGINLLVILAYSILLRISVNNGHNPVASFGILLGSAISVGVHVLVCLVIATITFSKEDGQLGKAWLLSSGIVLLVGFSACLGNAML